MKMEVRRLDRSRREDFYEIHGEAMGCGWCFCVAWWVPTWEGWGKRTAEQNRRLREELFERGEDDGYLLYVDGRPVGWCQAFRRDRAEKPGVQFGLDPDPEAWAIGCFFVAPGERRKGYARFLLSEAIRDLKERGARRIEAYPKRGEGSDETDLWNGPESMFRKAGFVTIVEDPVRPVLRLQIG
jgi:GNAT superfamily N-acetyltransferase